MGTIKIERVLQSKQDSSVNFVEQTKEGYIEARYVRRSDSYFIVYLSSQTGCAKGCKFCHLTASNQTSYLNVTPEQYLTQATQVINYYSEKDKEYNPATLVHFNWMSRGEALANPNMLNKSYEILSSLTSLSLENNLIPKFNVSTIMPKELLRRNLHEIFPGINPTIYYSLYSMNPEFRKKWIPAGLDPNTALDKLKEYQEVTKKIIKLHWAFIENENDDIKTLEQICKAVEDRDLKVEFNLVRYNPYSIIQGKEPSLEIIQNNLNYLRDRLGATSKIVSRVGFDVKASCGMFIEGLE